MARSLLRQLEQIRRAATYDDAVVGANTLDVAEPTASGSLEEDTNVLRTLLKQVKFDSSEYTGKDWFTENDNYFDPTTTDSGGTLNKEMTLSNIAGHTLDAKTIIVAVSNDDTGDGWGVSYGDSGKLVTGITTRYATNDNRMGLPIYAPGAYPGDDASGIFDEAGTDNVCRVDIIDLDTDSEIVDGSGNVIYGKLHNGADNSGTGDGTDVYVRYYADDAVTTMVSGVSDVVFVYPQRKRLTDMEEYEWLRTDFISSWEGDIELIEDITNLWSYTGASNDVTDPTWDNTTGNYILSSDPGDLTTAINLLNTEVGDRTYSAENYIDSGDTIVESLDELDVALKALADDLDDASASKHVETVDSEISANVFHSLPDSLTYTPEDGAGVEGAYMDVYVDGQLLSADTGAAGVEADRDYQETTVSGIKFRFDVQVGRNITYVIRK